MLAVRRPTPPASFPVGAIVIAEPKLRLPSRHSPRGKPGFRLVQLAAAVIVLAVLTGEARADRIADLSYELRTSSSEKTRISAAVALGRLDDPRAVEPLTRALRDHSRVVRAVAATALGHIGDESALPALRRAARDRDLSVRKRAREAAVKLENRRDARLRVARLVGWSEKPTDYQIDAHERPLVRPRKASLYIIVKSTRDRSPEPASDRLRQRRAAALRRQIMRQLSATPGVTLSEDEAHDLRLASFSIDVSIVKLERRAVGDTVQVGCHLRLAISDRRGRILSVLNGGAKVEVPRRTFWQLYLGELRREAMENAVKGVGQRLVTFLAGVGRETTHHHRRWARRR